MKSLGIKKLYYSISEVSKITDLEQYDCVLIVTDHSNIDYARIVEQAQLVIDTRNATRGIASPKIVRC